jgi:hypothetical protein
MTVGVVHALFAGTTAFSHAQFLRLAKIAHENIRPISVSVDLCTLKGGWAAMLRLVCQPAVFIIMHAFPPRVLKAVLK